MKSILTYIYLWNVMHSRISGIQSRYISYRSCHSTLFYKWSLCCDGIDTVKWNRNIHCLYFPLPFDRSTVSERLNINCHLYPCFQRVRHLSNDAPVSYGALLLKMSALIIHPFIFHTIFLDRDEEQRNFRIGHEKRGLFSKLFFPTMSPFLHFSLASHLEKDLSSEGN